MEKELRITIREFKRGYRIGIDREGFNNSETLGLLEYIKNHFYSSITVMQDDTEMLNTKLYDIDISVRLYNILRVRGVEILGDIESISEKEFIRFRGAGNKMLVELKNILKKYNLSFKSNPS